MLAIVIAAFALAGCGRMFYVGIGGKVVVNGTTGLATAPDSNALPVLNVTSGDSMTTSWSYTGLRSGPPVTGAAITLDLRGTVLDNAPNGGYPCGATAQIMPLVRGPLATDPWVEVSGFQVVNFGSGSFADNCKDGLGSTSITFARPQEWDSVKPGGKMGVSILVTSQWGFDTSSAWCKTLKAMSQNPPPDDSASDFVKLQYSNAMLLNAMLLYSNGCYTTSGDTYAASHTGMFELQVTPKPGTVTTPTARIASRATPVWVAGGAFADARTLWYEVDARTSTDPAGGALTYSWDLDGDGVYGDASATPDPAATLPTGVAIIPVATLDAAATAGHDLTVGVKVTNAAGQTSTAATTTVHPLPNQQYNDNYRSDFTLDTSTPAVGGTVTLTLETPMSLGGYACVDADADGAYETTVTLPYRTGAPLSTATTTTTALAAGPHLVTAVFIQRYGGATCANPTADGQSLTFRQVYVSTAARRVTARTDGYAGTGQLRLRLGSMPVEGTTSKTSLQTHGTVFNGAYAMPTSRAGDRPGALAQLRAGSYAARWTTVAQMPQTRTRTIALGTGYLLLDGRDGTMACLAFDTRIGQSTFTFVGGTGTASRLTGTLSGDALGFATNAPGGFATVGGITVVKPFTSSFDIAAATGAPRSLPTPCRSLVRYLPKAGGGGSATPSVVTG